MSITNVLIISSHQQSQMTRKIWITRHSSIFSCSDLIWSELSLTILSLNPLYCIFAIPSAALWQNLRLLLSLVWSLQSIGENSQLWHLIWPKLFFKETLKTALESRSWALSIAASRSSFYQLTGDHYRIGQNSVSHSFQNNAENLTKFSGFIDCNVELVHTKNYAAGSRWSLPIYENFWP